MRPYCSRICIQFAAFAWHYFNSLLSLPLPLLDVLHCFDLLTGIFVFPAHVRDGLSFPRQRLCCSSRASGPLHLGLHLLRRLRLLRCHGLHGTCTVGARPLCLQSRFSPSPQGRGSRTPNQTQKMIKAMHIYNIYVYILYVYYICT